MKYLFLISSLCLFVSIATSQERIVSFYFNTDVSELETNQKVRFNQFIDTLSSSHYTITDVQSFCDHRGTNDYNGELALRRLTYITNQLAAIGFNDLSSQSNGEELSGESTMQQDLRQWRKVEIHLEPILQVIDLSTVAEDDEFVEPPRFSAFDELTEEKIKLNNFEPIILKIEFVPGTNAIYDENSFYEIERLFQFMRRNENASAFIRGHVCCGSDLFLSMERAYVVYNSLIQRGISPNRLTFKGFDNTLPLLEETSEENMQKNRRVDVIFSFPEGDTDEAE